VRIVDHERRAPPLRNIGWQRRSAALLPAVRGSDLCALGYKEEGRKCGVLGSPFPQEELS
jgi:hypothetical protein